MLAAPEACSEEAQSLRNMQLRVYKATGGLLVP